MNVSTSLLSVRKAVVAVIISLLGFSSVAVEAAAPESAKIPGMPHSVKALDLSKFDGFAKTIQAI